LTTSDGSSCVANGDQFAKWHTIEKLETGVVAMRWPRLIGKNARLDVHGRGPKVRVV
jgi:D-galactarolactone cycloisomerase